MLKRKDLLKSLWSKVVECAIYLLNDYSIKSVELNGLKLWNVLYIYILNNYSIKSVQLKKPLKMWS